jgi:uncharacterized membrane protein
MSTAVVLVAATLVYAAFGILASQTGGRIDPKLGAAILNGVGAALPFVVWQAQRMSRVELLTTEPSGLAYSAVAGIAVGVFSILLVSLYGRGGELSLVFPTIYGGATAITAVFGWLVLGNAFSWIRVGGVAAIVLGIALLAVPVR